MVGRGEEADKRERMREESLAKAGNDVAVFDRDQDFEIGRGLRVVGEWLSMARKQGDPLVALDRDFDVDERADPPVERRYACGKGSQKVERHCKLGRIARR